MAYLPNYTLEQLNSPVRLPLEAVTRSFNQACLHCCAKASECVLLLLKLLSNMTQNRQSEVPGPIEAKDLPQQPNGTMTWATTAFDSLTLRFPPPWVTCHPQNICRNLQLAKLQQLMKPGHPGRTWQLKASAIVRQLWGGAKCGHVTCGERLIPPRHSFITGYCCVSLALLPRQKNLMPPSAKARLEALHQRDSNHCITVGSFLQVNELMADGRDADKAIKRQSRIQHMLQRVSIFLCQSQVGKSAV